VLSSALAAGWRLRSDVADWLRRNYRLRSEGGFAMDSLFDEVARILAQPQPRRTAFRLVIRTAAGAAAVALLPGTALAWDCGTDPTGKTFFCPSGTSCCDPSKNLCCPSGSGCLSLNTIKGAKVCCVEGRVCGEICCEQGLKCCVCGTTAICCASNQACGASNGVAVCVDVNPPPPPVPTCTPACVGGEVCCSGPGGVAVCCPPLSPLGGGCDSTSATGCGQIIG
jgi:hypothetical protein